MISSRISDKPSDSKKALLNLKQGDAINRKKPDIRAMIVDMLSCGELCACMILEKFEMSQSTLSHHLKILCGCELVKAKTEGEWTYYSLDWVTINNTKEFFSAMTSEKENCICDEPPIKDPPAQNDKNDVKEGTSAELAEKA